MEEFRAQGPYDIQQGKGRGKVYPPDMVNPTVSEETRVQVMRESHEQRRKRLIHTTTQDWTADVRDTLDEKNVRRMVLMTPMAQETVIRFYKTTSEIRNPQGHIANTIKGVREALENGLTYDEVIRIQSLCNQGIKMSYRPCRWFGDGRCDHGAECHHIHCATVSYGPKGKGKRKDDDDELFPAW